MKPHHVAVVIAATTGLFIYHHREHLAAWWEALGPNQWPDDPTASDPAATVSYLRGRADA